MWRDPDFDPSLRAFYYARVIEIPTPRWAAYDIVRFGLEPSREITMTTQERAYTSPIWYTARGERNSINHDSFPRSAWDRI